MSISVRKNWWETLFDDIYLITDARSVCDEIITSSEVELVCRLLEIRDDHRIIDLCGGHGRHSLELIARGYRDCTLLDYSPHLLKKARDQSRARGILLNIVRGDARNISFKSGNFDRACIMGNSLGYISEDQADVRIVSEVYRLLRSGGRILIDVADGEYVRGSFKPAAWHEIGRDIVVCRRRELREGFIDTREVVLDKKKGLIRDESYSIRLFDEEKLHSLLRRAGFSSIEIHKDFSVHDLDGDYGFMNNRMIAVGRKA